MKAIQKNLKIIKEISQKMYFHFKTHQNFEVWDHSPLIGTSLDLSSPYEAISTG